MLVCLLVYVSVFVCVLVCFVFLLFAFYAFEMKFVCSVVSLFVFDRGLACLFVWLFDCLVRCLFVWLCVCLLAVV